MSLNRVILMGTLTADPLSVGRGPGRLARACFTLEIDPPRPKRQPGGLPPPGAPPPDPTLAATSLAASATTHHAPRADFIPVLAYARTAEIALLFLRKGVRTIVEGRLREERWKPPHASERSRLVVVAERVTRLEIPRPNSAPPATRPLSIEDAADTLARSLARPRL